MTQFSTLNHFVDGNEEGQQLLDEAKQEIQQYLDELIHNVGDYFSDRETVSLQGCVQPFLADED